MAQQSLYEKPSREQMLAAWLSRPRGPHSPEAQAFAANVMREVARQRLIILNTIPSREWALAHLPCERGMKILPESEQRFDSVAEAERQLFLRGYEALSS